MEGAPGRPVVLRSSLREQVANALREELMAGRLPAGRHFTVKETAERYGVSATPVREALVDLSGQGLVRVEHHRGFAVPRLGWADYLELVEARTLVTDGVFRHLGARLCQADRSRLPSLRESAEAAERALRDGELDPLVGRDRRFWIEVGGLIGNQRVVGYLDWLRVQSWMFAAARLRGHPDLVRRCWSGHLRLTGLIAAGDRAAVERELRAETAHGLRLMAALCGEAYPDGPGGVASAADGYPSQDGDRAPGRGEDRENRADHAAGDVHGARDRGLTH